MYCLVQLVPLPPSVLGILSPQTYELYSRSLPGWPSEIPYANLPHASRLTPYARSSSPALLPTPDEVRKGAPIPFSDPSPSSLAPSPSRSASSSFRLTPASWLPLSIAPALTRTDLLQITAYGSLFFLVLFYPFGFSQGEGSRLSAGGSRPQAERWFFRWVLLAILLTGLLVAATGFIQRYTWNGKILWFFVPYDWGAPMPSTAPRASGPFVNPDHFANYLSLIFPLALACALFRASVVKKPLEETFRLFCAFTAFVLFTGILLSLSRSGWINALLGVSILLWFSPWRVEEGTASFFKQRGVSLIRYSFIILCFLLVMSLFFIGSRGREQVDTRLGQTLTQDAGLWGRATVWKDSLGMIRDFPLFGVGLGAWPELFPRYRRAPWSAGFYREAHNDYAELLAETGVIGFALLAWFFFLGGRRLLQGLKGASPKTLPLLTAILAALGVMAFHEWFDLNLQIPANAFLFTLLFALALRMGHSMEQGAERLTPHASPLTHFFTPNVSRRTALSVSVVAIVLVVFALGQERLPYPYNLKQPQSLAEASERLLSHPARASSHIFLLRRLENKASLAWQLSESGAALWLEPTNPDLRDLYASSLLRLGETDQGFKEITQSIVDSPSFSTHYYLGGKFLPWFSLAEQEAVENGFQQALAQAYQGAIDGLARLYAKLGRFSDEGMLYEQAALRESVRPKKADFLLNAGLAYAKAQDEAKAELLFRKAIAAVPNDPLAYHHLATAIYGPRKNIGRAKETVSEGIQNGAPPFSLYLSLAEAAQQAGSPGDRKAALRSAKAEVKMAARQSEDPHFLYLLIADAAHKAGDRDEEKAALLEALDLRRSSSNTLYRLANLYLREQDFDRAALYYRKMTTIDTNSAEVYYRLAMAEEGRYRFVAAAKAYARAVELAPDNSSFRSRYEGFKQKVEQNRKTNLAVPSK